MAPGGTKAIDRPVLSETVVLEPGQGMYFVYMLCNDAGILYTGIAKDTDARLAQHNTGAGARFTRGRGPWRMVHREGPLAHGDALRREAAIKADRRFKAALKAQLVLG